MSKQQQQDVRLVAVMGETGAGKSSFINSVLGKEAALVSDGSFSCTRSVEQFVYKRKDGLTVTLVDTPGFSDYGEEDYKTDAEILQMIAQFLKTQYDEKRKFSGIVFLHPINAGPAGSTAKNIRMFKRLCGSEQLKNVVVVTTRWDEACYSEEARAEAEELENSLMKPEGLLKELNDAGVRFLRAGHFSEETPQPAGAQYQSPVAVVESLLGLEPVYLQIQEEMAAGKAIQETAAGLVLEREFEDLKNTLNERMDNIQKTVELLQSTNDMGKAEREKQNEVLHMRIKEWEKLQGEFSIQWRAWEDCQKLNAELKQVLETSRKERDELSVECHTHRERERKLNDDLNEVRSALTRQTLDLQGDKIKLLEALNEVKSALAAKTAEVEIMKKENATGSVIIPRLRAQLKEMTQDRDRVKATLVAKTAEVKNVKQGNAGLDIPGLRAQLEEMRKERDCAKPQLETLADAPPVPVAHNAICDLCDLKIVGTRYKCLDCPVPGYDTCASCFHLTHQQHPGHSFCKIADPKDVICQGVLQPKVHNKVTCDSCNSSPILGVRYKCTHPQCPDFDLCGRCEASPIPVHPADHLMLKIKTPR